MKFCLDLDYKPLDGKVSDCPLIALFLVNKKQFSNSFLCTVSCFLSFRFLVEYSRKFFSLSYE